jgi:hypothetical protein
MNILKAIKKLFKTKDGVKRKMTYPSVEALRILHQMEAVEKQAVILKERHGADFNSFFYRHMTFNIIKSEVMSVLYPKHRSEIYTDIHWDSHWHEKHVLNFPGPIYTGVTDNGGAGECAPENVMVDQEGCEYIYHQPRNYTQLIEVSLAAELDPFNAYSCDGNKHWNYELVKNWWHNRSEWISQLMDPLLIKHNGADIVQLYIDYLNSDTAELDLRRYCFFLLNNYYPAEDNMDLPIIS